MGISGVVDYRAGGGSMKILPNDSGTNLLAKVINRSNGSLVITGGGGVTRLDQVSSATTIGESVLLPLVYMLGGTLRVGYNATPGTTWVIDGGTLVSARAAAAITIGGGANCTFAREDTIADSGPGMAFTNLTINNGYADIRGSDVGTITSININSFNGFVEFRNITEAITVTDIRGPAKTLKAMGVPVAGGGTIIAKNGKTITFTNAPVAVGGNIYDS